MATKPQIQTHPAAAVERAGRGATPTGSSRVVKFAAWKAAQEQGRTVAGYDKASPIYGKTDVDVLAAIETHIDQIATDIADIQSAGLTRRTLKATEADLVDTKTMLTELKKRKTARQIAGKLYRS